MNVATEKIVIFFSFVEHYVWFCLGLWNPNLQKIPETTIWLAHLAAYFGRSKSRQSLQRNPWKSGLVILQTSISCLLEKSWPVILERGVETITSAQCSSKTPSGNNLQTANFHRPLVASALHYFLCIRQTCGKSCSVNCARRCQILDSSVKNYSSGKNVRLNVPLHDPLHSRELHDWHRWDVNIRVGNRIVQEVLLQEPGLDVRPLYSFYPPSYDFLLLDLNKTLVK